MAPRKFKTSDSKCRRLLVASRVLSLIAVAILQETFIGSRSQSRTASIQRQREVDLCRDVKIQRRKDNESIPTLQFPNVDASGVAKKFFGTVASWSRPRQRWGNLTDLEQREWTTRTEWMKMNCWDGESPAVLQEALEAEREAAKPKKPPSSFLMFRNENLELLQKEADELLLGRTQATLSKIAKRHWKSLSDEDGLKYKKRYAAAVHKFKEELEEEQRRWQKKAKRPASAYQLFVKEHFHEMDGATQAQKMKQCAKAWKYADGQLKKPYQEKAQLRKRRLKRVSGQQEGEKSAWGLWLEVSKASIYNILARKQPMNSGAVRIRWRDVLKFAGQMWQKEVSEEVKDAWEAAARPLNSAIEEDRRKVLFALHASSDEEHHDPLSSELHEASADELHLAMTRELTLSNCTLLNAC